ncbi:hypothetical protein GUJ93_ZPchr0002g26259 [Zizania palustris]|uniref:Uncharacterized protein n=1 Tax=Zizania palustris TaxID=103762 RepID=A0A8J5VQN0_ZIZPA|nr:hypothetical protein GUJ93_ZPchr0002g26259 [Zizania palustris]
MSNHDQINCTATTSEKYRLLDSFKIFVFEAAFLCLDWQWLRMNDLEERWYLFSADAQKQIVDKDASPILPVPTVVLEEESKEGTSSSEQRSAQRDGNH